MTTSVTLEDPTARFDAAVDGELRVPDERGVVVSGTTNLAPGTRLTVRHLATGDTPLLKSELVTVGPDGRWISTADFADVPVGTAFTTSLRSDTGTLAAIEGRVVGEGAPTPTATGTPTGEATPTPIIVTRTVVRTPAETSVRTVVRTATRVRTVVRTVVLTPSPTATTTPGFAVPAALLALLAVSLLASRFHRRD